MVLISQLLDNLPALQSRGSVDGSSGLSSMLATFSARVNGGTQCCVTALTEICNSDLQAAIADASDVEGDMQPFSGDPGKADVHVLDATSAAQWHGVTDALQTWLLGTEAALREWAVATGILDGPSNGVSMLASIVTHALQGHAAVQQPDMDGVDEALILERFTSVMGRMRFVPYALALLSELSESTSSEVPRSVIAIEGRTAARTASDSGQAVGHQRSSAFGGEGGIADIVGGVSPGTSPSSAVMPRRLAEVQSTANAMDGVGPRAHPVRTPTAKPSKWKEVRAPIPASHRSTADVHAAAAQ